MIPVQGRSTLHHVQSWFLYSSMHVLDKVFGESLIDELEKLNTKGELIMLGEIAISQAILKAGYSICCS